jgi:hypothetical protein
MGNERSASQQAPPVLRVTALGLDSTPEAPTKVVARSTAADNAPRSIVGEGASVSTKMLGRAPSIRERRRMAAPRRERPPPNAV